MYKKLFITSVLCIGLMMVLGIKDADAFRLAGISFNPGGSVYCNSEWRGVGNLDGEDSYAEVECQIQPTLVTVLCSNNGGNIGGLGTPFVTSSVIAINEILNENSLSGKGRTFSSIYFSDELLFNSLFPEGYIFPEDTCDQNQNWGVATPDEGGIVIIEETWVTLNGYSAPDVLEDSGTFYCTLNATGDEYSCE
jgi:hypothetical protein